MVNSIAFVNNISYLLDNIFNVLVLLPDIDKALINRKW